MQTVTVDREASSNNAAPDFTTYFLADLQHFGQTTASQTRKRYNIPGTPQIGQAVRRLAAERRIRAVGFSLAVTLASQGHVERVWELSNGGGR